MRNWASGDGRLRTRARVRHLHHALRRRRRERRRDGSAGRWRRARSRFLPGPSLRAEVARHLDADLVPGGGDGPGQARAQRAEPPLRQPAVVARSVASLDILSGGRIELGIGAGAFWEAIEAMGGRRLTPGQGVDALGEAVEIIRGIWDAGRGDGLTFEGEHYRLKGAKRGPAPAHDVGIWIGAYKPRMLALTGRAADGWLPSVPYPGTRADREWQRADRRGGRGGGARSVGHPPPAQRVGRLLRRQPRPPSGSPAEWPAQMAEYALERGIGTFIAMGDDPALIEAFAQAAPAVRALVESGRAPAPQPRPVPPSCPRRNPASTSASGSLPPPTPRASATPCPGTRPRVPTARRRHPTFGTPSAAGRSPTPDRRARPPPRGADRAAVRRRPGARRTDLRRRRAQRAQPDGHAPERLDPGRLLHPLLPRRRPAPQPRGRLGLSPPQALRARARAGDRPSHGRAPRHPRRHRGSTARSSTTSTTRGTSTSSSTRSMP